MQPARKGQPGPKSCPSRQAATVESEFQNDAPAHPLIWRQVDYTAKYGQRKSEAITPFLLAQRVVQSCAMHGDTFPMKRLLIDISQPLHSGLPTWPGDPPVAMARLGDGVPAVSQISLGTHTGTHVDPPAHFIPGAATVDQLPLDVLVGPAWLAHISGRGPITARRLEDAAIPDETLRLLLRTDNSARPGAAFDPDFVALGPDAAQWLLARQIRLIGIDAPSIEPFDSPGEPVHRRLLAAGVVIVEGLALAGVASGTGELICLPLSIRDGDGAPARAVLVRST